MFPKKVFVQIQRKTQRIDQKQIWDRIAGDLHIPDLREAFGKIAQSRRKPRGQKKDGNCGCENKIPENQPVTTLKIGVRLLSFIPRNAIQPCLRRHSRVEWVYTPGCRGRTVAGVVDPGSLSRRANFLRDYGRCCLRRPLLRGSSQQSDCRGKNEQD